MIPNLLRLATNLAVCALAMGCVTTTAERVYVQPAAPPAVAVSVPGAEEEPFYDELAPYGEWVRVSGPGWAWVPYDTPAGWRPYQVGHWIFTDYGWTWASDESFGWAVYHYGRWHMDPGYGWVWVPGTEWGPAWVAWHEGGGYVGWAPLPWQVVWRAGIGLDWGGVNINVVLGPSTWYFVQARDIVAPNLRHCIVPASRNVTLIRVTQHVTNYVYVENRIVDRSVRKDKIGRALGRAIPTYRVRQTDSYDVGRGGRVRGQEFVVFRPDPSRNGRARGHDESYQRDENAGHDDRVRDSADDVGPRRRPIPPGHDRIPPRSVSERDENPADSEPGMRPRQKEVSDSDSAPQTHEPNRRPSRYPADSQRGPRGPRDSRRPPENGPSVQDASSVQEVEHPAERGPNSTPHENRANGEGNSSARDGSQGRSAQPHDERGPSSGHPPSAAPPSHGQPKVNSAPASKGPSLPGKAKGKKPAKTAPKPEEAKPDKPGEDSKPDDSKSE